MTTKKKLFFVLKKNKKRPIKTRKTCMILRVTSFFRFVNLLLKSVLIKHARVFEDSLYSQSLSRKVRDPV